MYIEHIKNILCEWNLTEKIGEHKDWGLGVVRVSEKIHDLTGKYVLLLYASPRDTHNFYQGD